MMADLPPQRAMRSVEFRREREATWRELEALIAEADRRGLRRLTAEQLARLPHLYRATLSSLSVARSISLDRALTEYLENLVRRAYFVVYGTREAVGRQLVDFFAYRLPSAVRRARRPSVRRPACFVERKSCRSCRRSSRRMKVENQSRPRTSSSS